MIIDGLQCGHFDRRRFRPCRRVESAASYVTCGFWEGTGRSLDYSVARRDLVRENVDIAEIATSLSYESHSASVRSIESPSFLGLQRRQSVPEGRIRFVEMFIRNSASWRVIQLTLQHIRTNWAASCC